MALLKYPTSPFGDAVLIMANMLSTCGSIDYEIDEKTIESYFDEFPDWVDADSVARHIKNVTESYNKLIENS